MLACLHYGAANRRMPVVRGGNDDCIQRLLPLKQHAVIAIDCRASHTLAVTLLGALDLRTVNITQSAYVMAKLQDFAHMPLDLTTHADESNVQLARRLASQQPGWQKERGCSGRSVLKKSSP
jgi:hypothetical protein